MDSLLARTAALLSKGDREKIDTLKELAEALNPREPQANKTRSRAVLGNTKATKALLDLSATTRSADVAENALRVLLPLAFDGDNTRRLLQEHPSLVAVVLGKLELNATEGVQFWAFGVLQCLVANVDDSHGMVTQNPTLVPLLVAKVGSNSESAQEKALEVLYNLTYNDDNAREMATKNPTLISLLMARVGSKVEQVQVMALLMLQRLAVNLHGMVAKNPTLVPLLVAKADSKSENVRTQALGVLNNLALSVDNKREMVAKSPALVSMLMAKVKPDSEQLQARALSVLNSLTHDVDNAREMLANYDKLVPLLVAKVGSNSEQLQVGALKVLRGLAINAKNARKMGTTLVPLLVAKVGSNSKQVQEGALDLLDSLAGNVDNAAEMMVAYSAVLLPLLVAKMKGGTVLHATKVVYSLSCSPANRAVLRGNNSVIVALISGRENEEASLLSLFALVNLFGADGDSNVLKTDLEMLQRVFNLIARAMNKDEWNLNKPLLAFRYLCVVEHNRQLLWGKYGSEFLTSVLLALLRAISDKDTPAVENAVSTLALFSNDPEPLVWMRAHKPQLDRVFAKLEPFPEALHEAQLVLLTVDLVEVVPAPVAAQKVRSEVEGGITPKQPVPQNEAEVRQWLSKHKNGKELADRLVKEDLVEDLKAMSDLSVSELVTAISFTAKQALTLHAALKELF